MNKKVFITTTVILILFFIAITILSSFLNNQKSLNQEVKKAEVPIKTLTFKDSFNKTIGTYKCHYKNCDYAMTKIDDDNYNLEYLVSEEQIYEDIINDRFALIEDYNDENDRKTIIYDIQNNSEYMTVDSIKTYNVDLENNYFIFSQDKKYGIVNLGDNPKILFNANYDYIGVSNQVDPTKNKLIAEKFAAMQNNKWMIIDLSGNALSPIFNFPIANYNGLYITTIENGKYKLYDYDGKEYFSNIDKDYISFTAKFVNIVRNKKLQIIDPATNKIIVNNISLEKENYRYENSFNIKIENNKLNILIFSNSNNTKKLSFDIKS